MSNGYRTLSQHLNDLKKENFSLKLRIYFLEERMQEKYEASREDVYKRVSAGPRAGAGGGPAPGLAPPSSRRGDGPGRGAPGRAARLTRGGTSHTRGHLSSACFLLPFSVTPVWNCGIAVGAGFKCGFCPPFLTHPPQRF